MESYKMCPFAAGFFHLACFKVHQCFSMYQIKLLTSAGSWKKQKSSRKTSISVLLTVPKFLPVWATTNSGKFFKRWE